MTSKEQKIKFWKHFGSSKKSRLSFNGDEATAESAFEAGLHIFSREHFGLGCGVHRKITDSAVSEAKYHFFQKLLLTQRLGEERSRLIIIIYNFTNDNLK